MIGPKGDLAAVELAFYGPAFLIGVFVVFRHGFSRQMGWLYIVVLSILRIIGAAVTLDMEVTNTASASLLETAAITSAVGTAPLLLALMGFLERINHGMEHKGISRMVFRPLHLISIAALVMAIIGGTDRMYTDASDMKTGKQLGEAAAMVFLGIYLALAGITLFNVTNVRWVLVNEKHLMRACVIAIPFLAVRISYSIASAFSNPGGIFYFEDVNVYAEAFMQFLMEAIVISLFIFAGLMTPKMEKRELLPGSRDVEGQKVEMISGPTQGSGRTAPRDQGRPRFQQPQSIGDYRPSRLIRNALRGQQ
ncbi:hypothetical protein B0A55_03816 [Friedmanniomyces simplex]|uniref:DUF7702 domain-containing protein n=1 Tax=Friedmanniomyces simplex TaxID=329884 RepID=A0A4U0XTT1_9PEZI|nr:hypothetical protein B0A55_03816 [Friedmanniomyces simplex]